jgi:drug/metabolite transporter (DMT)-like permease
MTYGVVLGLLASMLWALSSLLATRAVRCFGSLYYNCLRLLAGTVLLGLVALVSGGMTWPSATDLAWIGGSAVVGLTIGDLLLFQGFSLLGPRRAQLVFMLNIPMTAALGYMLFGEQTSWLQAAGTGLALVGIVMATAIGPSAASVGTPTDNDRSSRRHVDAVQGSLAAGWAACLLAALCQAIGLVMLKPVAAEQSYSMPQFAFMRFGVAALFAVLMLWHRDRGRQGTGLVRLLQADRAILWSSLGAVVTGSVIGFICFMGAIMHLPSGMAALLTSLSPIFVLPMLVVYARQTPPLRAWAGALIGCAGIYMTLSP